MSSSPDLVIASYAAHTERYENPRNLQSCWGRLSDALTRRVVPGPNDRLVVEVGCGLGRALHTLAAGHPARFIGIEPAGPMRERARERLASCPNVELRPGRFEALPLEDQSVDCLYSLLAFHWTQDATRSVTELRRVLRPGGRMDLFFPGRFTGQEFTVATMPVFLRRFGVNWLRDAASRRQHLSAEATRDLFQSAFAEVSVSEKSERHHDDLEGHWSWWMARAVAHLPEMPHEARVDCDQEIRTALQALATPQGIPYTIHLIHVSATR